MVGGILAWTKSIHQTQGELLFENDTTNDSGVTGTVTNIVTGQPIAGATIGVSGYATSTTNAGGAYTFPIPPGLYEIHASAPGFMAMSRVNQQVSGSSLLTADFEMIPLDPSDEDNQIIYDKLITDPEGPADESLIFDELTGKNSIQAVTVPSTIVVQWPDGRQETMPLEEYLKGVVPSEMPSSWPMEALKAQAIVARSYAIVYYLARGYICTTTACQVYSSTRYPTTSAAVDATSGQVITYNGNIVSTHYFSRCNGVTTRDSEHALDWTTCQERPWAYVAYERARPCTGHARYNSSCGYYGHGVGLCQWGAYYRALDSGSTCLEILNSYYTGISVYSAAQPPPPPAPLNPANGQFIIPSSTSITLSWSAVSGATYWAEGQRVGGGWTSQFGWTSSTSWPLGVLPKGLYQWRVKAKTSNGESAFSDYSYFVVSDTKYSTFFPRVDKNSAGN